MKEVSLDSESHSLRLRREVLHETDSGPACLQTLSLACGCQTRSSHRDQFLPSTPPSTHTHAHTDTHPRVHIHVYAERCTHINTHAYTRTLPIGFASLENPADTSGMGRDPGSWPHLDSHAGPWLCPIGVTCFSLRHNPVPRVFSHVDSQPRRPWLDGPLPSYLPPDPLA